MNWTYESTVVVVSVVCILFGILFKKKPKKRENIITKPYKYIIDVYDDSVSIYELDYGATHACNLTKFYYSNIVLSNSNPYRTERVSVSDTINDTFIYTNDVEKLYSILKQKGKLIDWMMTRIQV